MDYKKMWEELKESLHGYEPGIIRLMGQLEEKYDERYICIKDKDNRLIKDNKYEVVDQDQHYICVNGENDEWVYLSYGEFDEYFERKDENE